MHKRDLRLDQRYALRGDNTTAWRLIARKDPDKPQQVVLRDDAGSFVSIHPARIQASWDHPELVAIRETRARREAAYREAIDLAERLGFTVARDGDGWVAHRDAQARIGYAVLGRRPGSTGSIEIDLDAWLARAQVLAVALDVARGPDQATIDRVAEAFECERGAHATG